MHTKILKKILSILCVAAMSFSIAPSVGAIKTSSVALQSKALDCGSSICKCLKYVNLKLNCLNNYKFLKKFDNLDQKQTDAAIKLLTDLKNIIEKVNGLCLNDSETLNSISSVINTINSKINLIELKIYHNDCMNALTTGLNELKKIVDMQNKFEPNGAGKTEINVRDLVEKLNTKTEKMLKKIKNKKLLDDIELKWKELIYALKNTSSLKLNTESVILQIKILDDFVENLSSVDLQATEYYVSNFFAAKIQTAISLIEKLQKVDCVPKKIVPKIKKLPSILKKTGSMVKDSQKKVQIVEPILEKTAPKVKVNVPVPVPVKTAPKVKVNVPVPVKTAPKVKVNVPVPVPVKTAPKVKIEAPVPAKTAPKVKIEAPVSAKTAPKVKIEVPVPAKTVPKVKIEAPVSAKTAPKVVRVAKKVQIKADLVKDGEYALKNCDSTLENSMKLFEKCDKNYVRQALSSVGQLFSDAKKHPTDNVILEKCVKYWRALNEINGIKTKIMDYYKVLQNQSLENECYDILYKCFENFANNGEFDLGNIKHINSKLNQAMRPIINQKILNISNVNVVADSNLQTKWKNEIQAGRQTGLLCWLFAATNARNWFRVQNKESRIYGSGNVCNEYVKNKGNVRDLKSDQDYAPILKYLQNCGLSTYIVTSDIGNSDKDAQQTNRLLSEALLKKHFSANKSAVIVNKPGHWVAIAGIDTQTQKALVVDSLNESPSWTDLGSLCASISNIKDPKNPNCNGLSMIFVKDDRKSISDSAAFQNEDMSEWLNIFDDALKAASGEF